MGENQQVMAQERVGREVFVAIPVNGLMFLSENKVRHVIVCTVGADLSANRAHPITCITMKISRLKPLLRA